MKYMVEITETLQRQIEVEADTADQAFKNIKDRYKNEEFVLNEEDYIDTEINVLL